MNKNEMHHFEAQIISTIQNQRMVKIIESYTLHQQIGEGQYGKVYRGIDGRSGREVAAKVVNVRRFRQNPKLQECTLNEIEVLTRIDCPHIVRFIEILKTVNNFYFFYQFCNGGTLDQEIRRQGFLSESKVVGYLEQLIDAFRILTANNIMHRDLKPSNIMLHNGSIKLGDFGFCKSLQSQRDLAQTMLGSPIYMAPEVLRGEIYTVKADIWSLGVVVYEMAFGFCPFQQSSIARLINVLEHQDLQINRDINPISSQLQELLRLMLVKDHFKRISWEQLLSYSFRGGKVVKNSNGLHHHHRALSETNRIRKESSITEKIDGQNNQKQRIDLHFFKKRSQYQQGEDLHSSLKGIVHVIDRTIQQNHNSELTCIIALKLYRVVLRAHSRLGSRKDYLKERFQLTETVTAVAELLDSQQKENQFFETAASSPKYASLVNFLKLQGEENGSLTARQLEKSLIQAGLLKIS